MRDFESKNKFSEYESNFMRELCATKWDNLLSRVDKISDEVFEQVMETEMALVGLG